MNTGTAAALVIAGLVLASCGGDVGDATRGGGSGSSNGNLRLVNASQVSYLDLLEGSSALISSAPLAQSTGFVSLSTGTHTLTLRESGGSTLPTLATQAVTVSRDDHQTLLAYSTGTAPTTLSTAVLTETEPLPTSGNAKLRVVNTAGDMSIDVYVLSVTCSATALASATPIASDVVDLQGVYSTLTSPSTNAHVCVTAAGVRTTVLFDSPLVFSSQQVVTIVVGRTSTGATSLIAVDQPT